MKRNRLRKIIVAVALSVVLATTLFVLAGMAGETTNPLNIAYCNLSFENETHLLFAIESADANVQLLLWKTPQNAKANGYTYGTQDAVVPVAARNYDINGTPHTVFRYDGLTAKQMTDVVYVRACVVDA